jgi:CHAD domain-containing protein/phosphohistidine phosphatase SixA
MSRKPTIESLCRRNKNEDIHAQYVARLSLQIFDAVCPYLKLPLSLRPVLKAAALLHDIGYYRNPSDHQAEGGRIVLKKGVSGFSGEQCKTIAAAILLHRKDYARAYGDPFFRKLKNKETALRLGAIMRVADGLDHGHVQNASIQSVKNLAGGFLVSVSTPGFRGNVSWAQAKADLWKKIFLKELRIADCTGAEEACKFSGIVRPGDSVLDAARRLLYLHYRIVAEQYNGMIAGPGDEPLHDARVGLRRFRAALRLFSQFLPVQSTRAVDEQLASLALALSPIRDNDVWRDFLFSPRVSGLFCGNIDYVHFCALQSRMKKTDRQTLRAILLCREYSSLMRDINHFLRVELPQKIKKTQQPLSPLAGRRLAALYFEVLSRPGVKTDYDVKKMHRLRKLCRRARYWSEFFAPLLGRPAARFARGFKALADVLGDMHDTDMAVLRVRQQDSPIVPQLLRVLLADKRRHLSAFRRAWHSLRSPSMLYAATALFEESRNNTTFLYLARHASANATGDGENRLLDSQGIREAQTAGRALSLLQCRPNTIASSPLPRSLDTAAIVAQNFSFTAPVTKKQCLLPGSDIADTLAWFKTMHHSSCVCIGHMPHLAKVSKALVRQGSDVPVEFKKASACCISFPGGIESGKGTLEWYFTPKKMKRIVNRITNKRVKS